jgi:hypothetical protein
LSQHDERGDARDEKEDVVEIDHVELERRAALI